MKVALTGGIGSGKSTVLEVWRQALPGYTFGSVDDIVRGLYALPGYTQGLLESFGTCERADLSQRAFFDTSIRRRLEAYAMRWVAPALESLLAHPRVIVEFPLLYEMPGWAGCFEHVIALGCAPDIQCSRVLARPGMTEAKLERILALQLTASERRARAHRYIDTGGTLEDTRHAALLAAQDILRQDSDRGHALPS